jgi:hypothetical protein
MTRLIQPFRGTKDPVRSTARLLAVIVSGACSLFAQIDRANLTGTVTDASGAVVPHASVLAASRDTGLSRQVDTGSAGTYSITGLPIGTYDLTFSRQGFRGFEITGIQLLVGQTRTVDAALEIGAVSSHVDVQATAETLDKSNAEVGTVVETQQLREIPVNGRQWSTLMTLAPGAVNVGNGSQGSIRFFGRSRDDMNYTFDGIDATGVQEQGQKADARLNISMESIAEFRVSSAVYTAESGSAGGAQVNAVSKSGTNEFHGSMFDFLRNDAFDARSPFDPSQLPAFRMNQFGAEIGGPIVKNRSFFYVDYEGIRQSLGQTLVGFVPSATFRAAALSASPALKPILGAYPTGQTRIDANTDQLTVQGSNTVREDSGMVRFDQRFTDNTTMYARFNIDDAFIDNPNGAEGAHNTIAIRPSNAVVDLLHIFSPRIINEAKVGMNRSAYHNPLIGVVPVTINVPNFDSLSTSALDVEVGTTFTWADNLTIIRGRNTFKTGIDIERIRLNNSSNAIATSSISYTSLNSLVNNSADSIGVNAALGIGGMRRTFWMGYFQDDFKATPTLTLNLGLRYEYYSVMKEVKDRIAIVDVLGCGGFCPKGTPMYSPDTNDLGPRAGLAWSPSRLHGNTVIRAGFGIYYGANQNDDLSDPHESTAGRFALSSADVSSLSYPITPYLGELQDQGLSPKGIDRYRKDLYYENWDVVVQQNLVHSFVGQIGYVGSEGHNLFDSRPTNLINPLTGKRPLPQFGQFNVKHNDGNDNFNALQVSLKRSFTNGFLWQTQYMWSHSIADASVGAGESVGIQNAACRACDRSNSPYDVRHTMTTNAVYQLPFGQGKRYWNRGDFVGKLLGGWELSGIGTVSTGRPVNITVTRKAAIMSDGNAANQRPNLVPGVPIYAVNQTIHDWFNPAAFQVPAPGTWGNLGRYAARGPGYWQIDTALEKRMPLTERVSLKFRAEAFNVFNHPAFANPAANISAPGTLGRITSILNTAAVGTGTPRILQFMLRLDF